MSKNPTPPRRRVGERQHFKHPDGPERDRRGASVMPDLGGVNASTPGSSTRSTRRRW